MSTSQLNLKFFSRNHLPLILQDEMAECGHACVAMISQFWGQSIDLYTLRKINKPSIRGVNLRQISTLFEDLGFKTRALKISPTQIHQIQTPALLHWNGNHFVVLKKTTKSSITIHDPAIGLKVCSVEEFTQAFTGIILEVEKSADFNQILSFAKVKLHDLIRTVTGWQHFICILLILSLFLEILHLFNPLFLQYVTDYIVGSGDLGNLYLLAAGFLILALTHTLIQYSRSHLILYITHHLTEGFSSNVLNHLFKLPLEFFAARHRGDILSKFQSIEQIQKKMSVDLINTFLDGLMLIIHLIVMFLYSTSLTLIVVAGVCIFTCFRFFSFQALKKYTTISMHHHAKVSTHFLETINAIAPIKSFLKETLRFNSWRNYYIEALNADIKVGKYQIIYQSIQQLLSSIELIIVISMGAHAVMSNHLSTGMLVAFLAYRLLFINKTTSFIQHIFEYKLLSVPIHRLSDLLTQPQEQVETGKGHIKPMSGQLSLHNLAFTYHPESPNLFAPINLNIKAGEKIAIIGESGCGKSTLLKILTGLIRPTQGEIRIDGIPLIEFGLKNYRFGIAAVMQDDVLLSGSILDNIAFFDPTIDIECVIEAAQLAFIHDEIQRMPMGYSTLLGDLGSSLSGGQKQRLLLARALYKKPKILFLDEATSHLDIANEIKINQSLKSLAITQVIVAHRQETINMADRVFKIQN